MDKFVELIFTGIQKNLKNPKFYAIVAILVIIFTLVFPYIDANFLYYNRIEKRVDILQSISQIDKEKIAQTPALQGEYNAILSEISKQREWSISDITIGSNQSTDNRISLFKFIAGGVLAWLLTICVPFMNTFKDRKSKVLAFFLLALFGGLLGEIGCLIPTFFNPWINYIGFPILQLICVIALAINPKKQK